MPKKFPPEFQRDVVRVARRGDPSQAEVAADFDLSVESVRRWVRRVGWDDKQPVFRPIRHAWRVEVAHGRLGRARRPAKSFENTTASVTGRLQVACVATARRHLSAVRGRRRLVPLAA